MMIPVLNRRELECGFSYVRGRKRRMWNGDMHMSIYPNETGGKRSSYMTRPLTLEQRKALQVEQYYRPYHVNATAVLKERSVFWGCKRFFDVVFAFLALVALSPVILLAFAAILIEDPSGSPIFVQNRVGRNGKVFRFYKMRSMRVDAEQQLLELMKENEFQGKAFKMKEDPRMTRVGRFIRNTSIDELLQLVNIIKGDMSIVGPRPPLPREVELYDDYEKQRLIVTPGLTCFWQVCPDRHEISFDDWVALDIKYIAERSFWVDMKMIAKTVALVLRGNAD